MGRTVYILVLGAFLIVITCIRLNFTRPFFHICAITLTKTYIFSFLIEFFKIMFLSFGRFFRYPVSNYHYCLLFYYFFWFSSKLLGECYIIIILSIPNSGNFCDMISGNNYLLIGRSLLKTDHFFSILDHFLSWPFM